MEFQHLRILITNRDLTNLINKQTSEKFPLKNVEVNIDTAGMHVRGNYSMLVSVPLRSTWRPSVEDEKLLMRLTDIEVSGMPVNLIRGLLLKLLHDAAGKKEWLKKHGDTFEIDVEKLLEEDGFHAQCHLRRVQCQVGHLLLEAGNEID